MYVFFMCLFKRMQILVATASVVFLISSCSFRLTPKANVNESSALFRASNNSNNVLCSGDIDCMGVCNGPAELGCDGVCNSGTVKDCDEVCGGSSTLDCDGVCGGTTVLDDCGVCDGTGSSCADCNGTPNGGAVVDSCGVCDGDGSTCSSPTITYRTANCGLRTLAAHYPYNPTVFAYPQIWVPPAPGQVCCAFGANPTYEGTSTVLYGGISMSADECCARGSLKWTEAGGAFEPEKAYQNALLTQLVPYPNSTKPELLAADSVDSTKRCCATTPYIGSSTEAYSSIKLVPIAGGAVSESLSKWNGNLPSYNNYTGSLPPKIIHSPQRCLPMCSRTTQNQVLNGSDDPRYPYTPKSVACCRVACTGDDRIDFDFTSLRGGSTCTPTSGVNGNEKGICVPCPECEYKKQLPSVLTPCTHDQLLAERSQGKVPLCEKEAEVCTAPQ